MTRLYFDPNAFLLVFPCRVEYQRSIILDLALDTGATTTIVCNEALVAIGCTPEALTEFASFGDASATHLVPKINLKSFSLDEAKVENLEVLCYTIPEEHGIDGVIGLNFLRHFNLTLNFNQGILTLER